MEKSVDMLLESLRGYKPERVILFGSAARGESDAESDLDVLVIKKTNEPFISRLEAMADRCPVGVHADILVYTPEEIERMVAEGNPFITQALREGKVIYEAKP